MTKQEKELDLLPCPFCGAGRTSIGRTTKEYGFIRFYLIKCYRCGAQTQESDDLDDVVTRWNRRGGVDYLATN